MNTEPVDNKTAGLEIRPTGRGLCRTTTLGRIMAAAHSIFMMEVAMPQPLMPLVQDVADRLKSTNTLIVFAESCTAGLVSAIVARVPGISQYHCGSAVVYQLDTKSKWLGISPAMLDDPGPVSAEVARAMAIGVLERTPAAQMSASITGHLGPNAPEGQDGLAFVGIARRGSNGIDVHTFKHIMPATIDDLPGLQTPSLREWRQWKAAELVLTHVLKVLS